MSERSFSDRRSLKVILVSDLRQDFAARNSLSCVCPPDDVLSKVRAARFLLCTLSISGVGQRTAGPARAPCPQSRDEGTLLYGSCEDERRRLRCHRHDQLLTQQQNHLLTWVSLEKDALILFYTHVKTVPLNRVTGRVGRCRIVTLTSCIASALPVFQRQLILSRSVGTRFLPHGLVFT